MTPAQTHESHTLIPTVSHNPFNRTGNKHLPFQTFSYFGKLQLFHPIVREPLSYVLCMWASFFVQEG